MPQGLIPDDYLLPAVLQCSFLDLVVSSVKFTFHIAIPEIEGNEMRRVGGEIDLHLLYCS